MRNPTFHETAGRTLVRLSCCTQHPTLGRVPSNDGYQPSHSTGLVDVFSRSLVYSLFRRNDYDKLSCDYARFAADCGSGKMRYRLYQFPPVSARLPHQLLLAPYPTYQVESSELIRAHLFYSSLVFCLFLASDPRRMRYMRGRCSGYR